MSIFYYFKNYFQTVLPVPVKRSVNRRNKRAVNRCSCKDLMSNSSQSCILKEYGGLFLLLRISDHYIESESLKNFSRQLLFLGNHLNRFFLSSDRRLF